MHNIREIRNLSRVLVEMAATPGTFMTGKGGAFFGDLLVDDFALHVVCRNGVIADLPDHCRTTRSGAKPSNAFHNDKGTHHVGKT